MSKEEILEAIRRAAGELGRAPSRGELRRITGVSHYKVLAEFRTLREAVREAGLEPNKKGERIETEKLLADWKRVEKKLGRRPSRAEYVREGRYSAGAFVARFGSWGNLHHGGTETRRKAKKRAEKINHKGHKGTPRKTGGVSADSQRVKKEPHKNGGDKAIAFQWGERLAPLLPPLAGKRRITEMVAMMVVNTLLGANSNCQMAISQNRFTTEDAEKHGGRQNGRGSDLLERRGVRKGDLGPSLAVTTPLFQDDELMRADFTARGINKGRAVMGPPFDEAPMTNAPMNELGVVFMFGMVAAAMGFQVESLQGKFPDCEAKREVARGKWQRSRIEFEYESKNFHLHGHDPKGCDVIVCWRHNWKGCPAELEVIELSRMIGRKQLADGS